MTGRHLLHTLYSRYREFIGLLTPLTMRQTGIALIGGLLTGIAYVAVIFGLEETHFLRVLPGAGDILALSLPGLPFLLGAWLRSKRLGFLAGCLFSACPLVVGMMATAVFFRERPPNLWDDLCGGLFVYGIVAVPFGLLGVLGAVTRPLISRVVCRWQARRDFARSCREYDEARGKGVGG